MRVLLVEDHDDLREATMEVLQGNGFTTVGLTAAEEVDEIGRASCRVRV